MSVVKIDDRVIVWDNNREKYKEKRHFAGWSDDGRIMTFPGGATSWSWGNGLDLVCWDNYEVVDVGESQA